MLLIIRLLHTKIRFPCRAKIAFENIEQSLAVSRFIDHLKAIGDYPVTLAEIAVVTYRKICLILYRSDTVQIFKIVYYIKYNRSLFLFCRQCSAYLLLIYYRRYRWSEQDNSVYIVHMHTFVEHIYTEQYS